MYQKMDSGFMHDQTSIPQQFHLTDYLNIIRKRKLVVITFLLVVVCIVAYKTYNTARIYQATTRIIIEDRYFAIDKLKDITGIYPKQNLETQLELLMSRSLASKAIEDLRLRKYIANRPQKKPDLLTLALNKVRNFIGTLLSPSKSDTRKIQPAPTIERSESEDVLKDDDPVVSWYLSKLKVAPVKETSLINISFLDSSPEMVARVANAHARVFIERNIQMQNLESKKILTWLKTQLKEQKLKIEASQQLINEYKYEQLRSLSADDERLFALPEVTQNSVIQDLRSQLVRLKAQKLELSSKFGPKHPNVIEINLSIKKFKQQIANEIQQISAIIKMQLDHNQSIANSTQQTQDLQQQAAVLPSEDTINYYMLQLEEESEKEIYDILLMQAKEISLTANMENKNVRIVDEAEVPRYPFKPNIINNILLSIVMGLAFGIGFAFFIEYMDKRIMMPEDIMKQLGISVIGMLPYEKSLKGNKQLALPLNESHNAQKKRIKYYNRYNISGSLVSSLPLMQSGMSGQVFMVESATSGEGKTTVLAKSAISLARAGLRVVMVDADAYQPALHNLFGLKNNGDGGLFTAVTKILSHKIREGNLDKYSMDDLFFLIALKRESGRLIVTHNTQTMTAVFENGHLLHLQSQHTPPANQLGTMLLRGGLITESQLNDALERNKRTGQPLGYILVNAGYISLDQLKGPSKLQKEEHLQKLFSWKEGTFVFEPGRLETYEDKKIYFQEDYVTIINRLGRMVGNHLLEDEVLSYVKQVNEPNLSILPAGTGSTDSLGPLYFTLLAKYFDILKQRFDVVLVDAPPVLETMGSIKSLVSLADGVIFVIKSGHISVKTVNEALNYMKEGKAKIIGTILNGVKIGSGHYYHGYYK